VTTPSAAIKLLESGDVALISFDHDLGYDEHGEELTGYQVLLWIEQGFVLRGFKPHEMLVHSANPPGHERLLRGIEAIKRRADETLG
jgi:hypothetical protein